MGSNVIVGDLQKSSYPDLFCFSKQIMFMLETFSTWRKDSHKGRWLLAKAHISLNLPMYIPLLYGAFSAIAQIVKSSNG